MLTQLKRLSMEADGRYASAQELKFARDYFESLPLRVSAYQKLRDSEDEILEATEAKMRAVDPKIYMGSAGDFFEIWKRDTRRSIRYTAATVLFNDRDRLNEGMLIWFSTITKSYKFDRTCKTCFMVMPEVMKQYLSPEEFALVSPIISLNSVVLS